MRTPIHRHTESPIPSDVAHLTRPTEVRRLLAELEDQTEPRPRPELPDRWKHPATDDAPRPRRGGRCRFGNRPGFGCPDRSPPRESSTRRRRRKRPAAGGLLAHPIRKSPNTYAAGRRRPGAWHRKVTWPWHRPRSSLTCRFPWAAAYSSISRKANRRPARAGDRAKEVADRLAAKPATADYGLLSVRIQVLYDVVVDKVVSPGCFFPPP